MGDDDDISQRCLFSTVGGRLLYLLMHDDVEVASFEADASSGAIVGKISVQDRDHMPQSYVFGERTRRLQDIFDVPVGC